jgi:hypothetical protein
MKSLWWVELGLANFLKPATHALFLLSLPTALVHESTLSEIWLLFQAHFWMASLIPSKMHHSAQACAYIQMVDTDAVGLSQVCINDTS